MAKKSKNSLIIVGMVIVLIVVGMFVYAKQRGEPAQNQPVVSKDCEIFDGKEYCAEDYIGLGESEAMAKAEANGLRARVIVSDENANIKITFEQGSKRINFHIKDKVVVKAEFF